MKKAGVLVLLLIGVAWFVYDTYKDAGELKDVQPHFDGRAEKIAGVVGPEDITIHPEIGVAFISSDDRRATLAGQLSQGAVYAFDLCCEEPDLRNVTGKLDFEFHPHGISLFVSETGADRLFAINHRSAGEFVEIFAVGGGQLTHLESISGPLMHSPNDLVAVGPRQFYVTNDHGSTTEFGRTLEEYLRLAKSNVLFFDGQAFTEVAGGVLYANGINISSDGEEVYVAATTGGEIRVYDRDISTNSLSLVRTIALNTGVDNIELDAAGNLWVAAHPKLLTFVAHARDASKLSPSQVLKITLTDGTYSAREVLLDDGSLLSASSVAAVFEGRLLVGSVFQEYFLLCELEE